MKRFEYEIVVQYDTYVSKDQMKNFLNTMGQSGWELVESIHGNRRNIYNFKREITEHELIETDTSVSIEEVTKQESN